jgi:hypothetical protein
VRSGFRLFSGFILQIPGFSGLPDSVAGYYDRRPLGRILAARGSG